jgi:hypothetical protein
MSESDHNATISVESMGANLEIDIASPADHTRRTLILTALAAGVCVAASQSASVADEDPPGSDERPQKADLLVVSEGDQEAAARGSTRCWSSGSIRPKWMMRHVRTRPTALLPIQRSVPTPDVRSQDGRNRKRAKRTSSNALVTIPNMIHGKVLRSYLDRRHGVLRRFRWRSPTAHSPCPRHLLER